MSKQFIPNPDKEHETSLLPYPLKVSSDLSLFGFLSEVVSWDGNVFVEPLPKSLQQKYRGFVLLYKTGGPKKGRQPS